MCLLAILVDWLPDAPIIIAANREEYFDRPSLPPHLQTGSPRILCGIDQRAGGTWLGVNEHGVFVAITNRPGPPPTGARSRGSLTMDLLRSKSADEAARHASTELRTGRYAGANYVCADRGGTFVVHGNRPAEILTAERGLHLLANGDLDDPDDPHLWHARAKFDVIHQVTVDAIIARAEEVCSLGPETPDEQGIVLRAEDRGTVSSTIVALTNPSARAVYRHANGAPDRTPYLDYSSLLRELLAARMA
ncbi:MAG: NRDE family protein [Planctomycetota bacterium]